MTDVFANSSSNATEKPPSPCQESIDERTFDLGCLAPAIVIILILACLKRRNNWKLDYCNGYPGLLIPINFLGGVNNANRYTIAITFGATASTFFTNSRLDSFALPGPPWVKVFSALIAVLVYGILFYPFFACLTTEYRLIGSLLGFLYVTMRLIVGLVIEFECKESYEKDVKTLQYLEMLGKVPTYLCLLFIAIRFAVLLFLQIRQKWLRSNSMLGRAGEYYTSLIETPGIIHVRQLINPGLTSEMVEEKWYKKLIFKIYRPRPDFKFSTQLISTLVVAGIILFQVLISVLALFDYYKKQFVTACGNDSSCASVFRLWFGALEGGFVTTALFSILLMLHFMKCHRDHIFQLYKGHRSFSQDVVVSPSRLVGKSLLFPGYQIAFVLTGNAVFSFFLAIIALLLALIFKFIDVLVSPEMLKAFEQFGMALLPTIGMAVFLLLFQLFLTYFVFRDRDFPDITLTVDNRRLFSIMSYFFFFYNILLGVFSCIMRIVKGMLLGVVFLSRIDRTSLMQGFQTWDKAFVAYLGFIHLLVAHSHPVMLMFCQLLINRNKERQYERSVEEEPPGLSSVQHSHSKDRGSFGSPRALRLPRMSHKAINRWFVAVTLLRNPSLVKHRRQGARKSSVTQGNTYNGSDSSSNGSSSTSLI